MTDLLADIAAAIFARNRKALGVFSDQVAESGDADLLSLWIGYCSLLDFRAEQQGMLKFIIQPPDDRTSRWVAEIATVTAGVDALLSRLDTAWTAYLALRSQQQEPT